MMRLEMGITQDDLAKRLGKAFVTINRWENGRGFPSRSNARKIIEIAKSGNVSIDCSNYLYDVLMPEAKRGCTANSYGFPNIDREFLFQLADYSANAIYVVDESTFSMLYANRTAEKMACRDLAECNQPVETRQLSQMENKKCYHYFGNRDKQCPFCPIADMKGSSAKDFVITIPENKRSYNVHAKRTELHGRSVFIINITDITAINKERQALYELTNDIPEGVGIYHLYPDQRIELAFMNKVLFELIGEERGKSMLKNGPSDVCLVHPDDKPRFQAEVKEAAEMNRDISLDMRMRTGEGVYSFIHLDGKIIKKTIEKSTFYCVFKDLGRAE